MPLNDVAVVTDQIQKKWAPIFMKELRESLLLGGLVNKDYEGAIGSQGDTVKVSQLNAAAGQLRTVGTDADVFDSEQMSWEQVEVKADKRAVAAFEVAELAQLQSQLDSPEGQSELRKSLMFAVEKQVNNYLWSLVAPSSSSPDHLLASTATLDASVLGSVRTLAARAKWLRDGKWYGLLTPGYYQDVLNAQTMTSSDYIGGEQPVIGGQIVNKRFGFNLLEDNSRTHADDKAIFFHPDFVHMVMQKAPQFKVSDLHSQKKFGYLISVDLIFGAKLGIDGAVKHIAVTEGASLNLT